VKTVEIGGGKVWGGVLQSWIWVLKAGGEGLQKQRLMDLIDLPVWLSKADDNMQLYEVFGAANSGCGPPIHSSN
jgi:hypothetical protein